MNACHVLVVEDDVYGSQVVMHMLKYHKIDADAVPSGETIDRSVNISRENFARLA